MDFITATANLRGANYSITSVSKHKCKGIAGKIIPAMVTTTAVVSGLINFEFVKLLLGKPLEQFKNGFVNLALPFLGFSEPIPPPKTEVRKGWEWNLWDYIEMEGNPTLKEFVAQIEKNHQVDVDGITTGHAMIYANYLPQSATKLATSIQALYEQIVLKKPLPDHINYITFDVSCTRKEDDEEANVPSIRLKLR
eukprot:TRINITY_DN5708_c0_g1_i2.p1 TRINITY_DN5708_c0_g1~~TRINITY_DN5708_c0_g1_i2.p1  ORF type:complete len:195 (+),score=73.79 TRINITY_DN5708_c0_g1_i2:259-843(+)